MMELALTLFDGGNVLCLLDLLFLFAVYYFSSIALLCLLLSDLCHDDIIAV